MGPAQPVQGFRRNAQKSPWPIVPDMTATRDFIAGGYFLTRPVERNDQFMAADLLPEHTLTLSSCLTDPALEFWWNHENVAEAADFGVPSDRWPDLIAWYLDQFESRIGAPGVAYETSVTREFVNRFVPDPAGLVILGCGLDPESAARLITECRTAPDQGEYGVFEMVEKSLSMEAGGILRGFEVVSYEYGLEHSWLCNSLQGDVNEELGIAPNDMGLLDTFEEAATVAEYVNRDEVGAEPGLWLPWLVVEYPLGAT